jgi:hypothetical protein
VAQRAAADLALSLCHPGATAGGYETAVCQLVRGDHYGGSHRRLALSQCWATDHARDEPSLRPLVSAARTRWKSENENNTVLKNYGYHLEHNFGYGGQYRAMVLVMLNRLAFLVHTVLDLCDEQYRRVRCELATRQTFVSDLPALTRDLYFDDWQALITFMFSQLELDQASPSPPRRRSKYR